MKPSVEEGELPQSKDDRYKEKNLDSSSRPCLFLILIMMAGADTAKDSPLYSHVTPLD